jgi:hypothetical protein
MGKTTYERRDVPEGQNAQDFLKSTAKSFNNTDKQKLVGIKVDKHSKNPEQLCLKVRTFH